MVALAPDTLATAPSLHPPYRVARPPFQHQWAALAWLRDRARGALFMEMGTGKTKVMIDHVTNTPAIRRVLVLCPISVQSAWVTQLALDAPTDSVMMVTGPAATRARQIAGGARWTIAGYDAARLDEAALARAAFECVVLDESTRVKHHTAQRSRAAQRLAAPAAHCYLMTGTPVTQSYEDLFGQFLVLDPTCFGRSFLAFRARYCVMGGYRVKIRERYQATQIIDYQHVEELRARIAARAFQVKKAACLDLPPKVYEVREVHLGPIQAGAYRAMQRDFLAEVAGGTMTATQAVGRLLKLQQIAGNTAIVDGARTGAVVDATQSPKVEALLELLEEGGAPMIVWCRFLAEIQHVAAALADRHIPHCVLTGALSSRERAATVARFQDGQAEVFVGQVATGGLGITLTRASTVVYYSNDFSLETRWQSEDRAHRIGTTRTVTIVDLVAAGTVDASILRALARKEELAATLLAGHPNLTAFVEGRAA